MIVSTMQGTKGVLAEFVSSDLKSWEHKGVFMSMMWDRFYECPDVFKMGDWWYLVYSEKHVAIRKVQYFKGRTLDELKACTVNDAGKWLMIMKVFWTLVLSMQEKLLQMVLIVIFGAGVQLVKVITIQLSELSRMNLNAGNLVAHRIIQHEDGSLSLGSIQGIDNKFTTVSSLKVMAKSENGVSENGVSENAGKYVLTGNSFVLFNRLNVANKISFTVKATDKTDKFGFSFARGTDSKKYYSIIVNPEDNGNKKKLNFEEQGEEGMGFVAGIDGYLFNTPADNEYHVTVYTDNSVCVVYINDNVAYTNRIYGTQKNCWSINSYEGTIEVSNIEVSYY